MDFTEKGLLEDLKVRGMAIQFGKGGKGKERALSFKKYAAEHSEKVHVILDERKVWAVVTDVHFKSVNEAWKKYGRSPMKSYE